MKNAKNTNNTVTPNTINVYFQSKFVKISIGMYAVAPSGTIV